MTAQDTSPGYAHRVLVFGGRDWKNGGAVWSMLDALAASGRLMVISGGAPGADTHAIRWAEAHGDSGLMVFRAKWLSQGHDAGPIRNQRMLDEGRPTIGLQFPGHEGTRDMRERLDRAGVPVIGFGEQIKLF